ncbi:MAG: thermonuclease family protein [Hyphomicrobium sp.]|jgi:endonuclease YncB( thermonuclease family)
MGNATQSKASIAQRQPRRRTSRQRRDRYWRYRRIFGSQGGPRQLAIAIGLAVLAFLISAAWQYYTAPVGEDRAGPLALCNGAPKRSCLIDGDTGRDNGRKWRLISIDAPELADPACEHEMQLAIASRDRLQQLLAGGYKIRYSGRTDPHGRALVDIALPDGRDAGQILKEEGLAQKWPNRGNIWCNRFAGRTTTPGG